MQPRGRTASDDGSGPPILMVQGPGSKADIWAEASDMLSPRFRVIRWEPTHRTEDPVEELLALLDELAVPAAHLVGFGSGCRALANLALQAPARALSLTAVDPMAPDRGGSGPTGAPNHLDRLMLWLENGYGGCVRKPEHTDTLRALVAQQTFASFHPAEWNPMLDLADLACPLLALVGQDEDPGAKTFVATRFGQAPRFQFSLVPGARRQSPVEAPAVVALLLDRFIESLYVTS